MKISGDPLRRTKIVATLGPATDSPEMIGRLVSNGANVFRLNFSHGEHDDHRRRVDIIRDVEAQLGRPLGILQDLQGPKIRTESFADPEGVELEPGAEFALTRDDSPGDVTRVGLGFPALIDEIHAGDRLLLRDGLIELLCTHVTDDAILTRVAVGGRLRSHSGINVPDADLSIPAVTEKDVADLAFGVEIGVDWVALSFVRTADDLRMARQYLERFGSNAKLMAKIEKPGAVARFSEILAEADGVMVARGDLGVEMPPEEVPMIQKRILCECMESGKPAIVATQMLESMIQNPRPTRAEASDVATAIFDLADAVMLSGETAIGEYPAEAVRMMDQVAMEVEDSEEYGRQLHRFFPQPEPAVADAVCHSAARLAQILPARALACFTWSGSTARRIARHRPEAPIFALTPFQAVARALTLQWGVIPLVADDIDDSDKVGPAAVQRLRAAGLLQQTGSVVATAGIPFAQAGTTNMIHVEEMQL